MKKSSHVELGVVVTTLGRVEALHTLLESLQDQLNPDDELVIVAQENHEAVSVVVSTFSMRCRTEVVSSRRGASRGRNVGVAHLEHADLLIFPNDTTSFPQGSINAIRKAGAQGPVVIFTVQDPFGPKFRFRHGAYHVNFRNIWNVIEPGFAISREDFAAIDGFNPDIGTGASTPWQAGEVADLLFRWQAAHLEKTPSWQPSISVTGVEDAKGLSASERRRKLRAYGRGCGFVMTTHHNPLWFRIAYTVAGAGVWLRRPGQYSVVDGWWAFLGRCEGITRRVIGSGYAAVNR